MSSIARFKQFCIDTWGELKKVTWPTKKEVQGTTIVVIVAVLLSAAYLFVVDLILSQGMERLLAWFG